MFYLMVGGMLGYILGYATAILMIMAKKTDEEGEDEIKNDGRWKDI